MTDSIRAELSAGADDSVVMQLGFTAEPIVDIGTSSADPLYSGPLYSAPLYSECLAQMMVVENNQLESGDVLNDPAPYGHMDLLDEAVVDLVLDALSDTPNIALGCNISLRTLSCSTAWASILRRIDARQWLAKRLTLEISETYPLSDISDVARRLSEVQRLGCQIAIDDFGANPSNTSPSSASQFHGVNIKWDIVKIDRGCFRTLQDGPSPLTRLHSLVSQASRFAPIVVVDGIETYDRLSVAQDAGVRFGQGWLFDGPVRDRWMMPGTASQLTKAILKYRMMAQQLMQPAAPAGQGNCLLHTRSGSPENALSDALAHDVADLLRPLIAPRGIGAGL